jgi:predicted ribosomally synthesized peptide with SipW-like signal peptide/uncharacterized repeat protein (TIGR01451 family)
MNKKLITALALAAIMTFGAGASSYAWFTSTATSANNTFKAGTLSVTGKGGDVSTTRLGGGTADLTNMEPGDTATYTYIIDNMKDGTASSLNLVFANKVTPDLHFLNDNIRHHDSLLEVAKFDLTVTKSDGANFNTALSDNLKGLTFAQLEAELAKSVTLTGGNRQYVTYTITVNLPQNLIAAGTALQSDEKSAPYGNVDNLYQDKSGSFTISTEATQTNDVNIEPSQKK